MRFLGVSFSSLDLRRVSRNGGACLRQGVSSSRIWASLVSSLLIRSGGVGWWRVGFLLAWCLAAEAHLAVIQEVFGVFHRRVQVCSSAEAASRLWLRPIPGSVASSLIPQVTASQLALGLCLRDVTSPSVRCLLSLGSLSLVFESFRMGFEAGSPLVLRG